jgi:hypothetical protein
MNTQELTAVIEIQPETRGDAKVLFYDPRPAMNTSGQLKPYTVYNWFYFDRKAAEAGRVRREREDCGQVYIARLREGAANGT